MKTKSNMKICNAIDNITMLTTAELKSRMKPELVDLWEAACACLDDLSEDSFSKFRDLCRPADIMLLIRMAVENSRNVHFEQCKKSVDQSAEQP